VAKPEILGGDGVYAFLMEKSKQFKLTDLEKRMNFLCDLNV